MPAFSPEISARALIPKEILGHASSLHLIIHINMAFVEVAVAEAAGGEIHWSGIFFVDGAHENCAESVIFISERNWFDKVFRKCTVSFDSKIFTLVPKAFFNPDKAEELLRFQSSYTTGDIITQEIPEMDAIILSAAPTWSSQIQRMFPNARIIPSAALFLRFARSVSLHDGNSIHLFVTPAMMVLAAYQSKKLLLLNAHDVHSEEDILYYSSNAAMRLQIDFENALLNVFDTSNDNNLPNLLKHYNKNVTRHFWEPGDNQRTFITNIHIQCA